MAKAQKKINFQDRVVEIIAQIQSLYLSDDIPWVIGYSGGKDSTAIVQLTWIALQQLEAEKRKKEEAREEAREKARKEKNFNLADQIRLKLKKKGIILEDTEKGVRWKKTN